MEQFINIVIGAMLVESLWETLKMVWQEGKFSFDKIGALAMALLVAVVTNLNVFPILNIEIYPLLGCILTGILLSRGSNFVHDLLDKIAIRRGMK